MVATTEKIKLWTCPKCKRQFIKNNQVHSCRQFPIEKHFERKAAGANLYQLFQQAIKKNIGPFKVDSLECCIHFCTQSAFAGVKIQRNKIRVDFTLPQLIRSRRFIHSVKMSANRHLYYVDINSEEEIDDELIEWLKKAYRKE